jgi:hypothetical protein
VSALRLRAAAVVVASTVALALPSAAVAVTWQPDRDFEIDPAQVPGYASNAAAAKYLLRDQQGTAVGPVLGRPADDLYDWFRVPPVAGVYELEAWLEDAQGQEIRRADTSLAFDDVPPQPPVPAAPARWLPGGEVASLKIGHPAGPQPLSGLRGYAVSLDRGSGGGPCAEPSRCTPAETDLGGGIEDDSLALGALAEGTVYARVVAVSGSGVPSPIRTATFRVDATPPQLSLAGVEEGWSNGPVRLTALAQDSLSGMVAAGVAGPLTAIAIDGAAPAAAPGDLATTWVSGSGVHAVAAFARDAAGNVAGGLEPASASVRIDEDPPQVRFATAQDPAEPERIEALVTDPLSGPSPGSGSIAVRLAGTRARYQQLPTTVTAGRLISHWDSDSYPPGKYEFLATGFDVAGNAAGGTDRARGGRMVLVNPLKTPVTLTAKLTGRRFAGRLRRFGIGPAAAERVAVVETFAAGAAPRRRTTVRSTDASGNFSLRLKPGPSRDVAAHFAGTPTLTKAGSSSAHLDARTGLRLRASRATARVGGAPVIFSGTVGARGARAAVDGLAVELQFRYPGAGWRGFRTVETDRRGRFRYAYRFSDDDSRGIRFRFRAHVKGREGWPYKPSASRPVTVTGR